MKNILFLTAFPPNNQTAGQNYTRLLLDDLVKIHNIDIIIFNYNHHKIQLNSKINILKKYPVTKISKIISVLKIPFLHPFFTCRFHFTLLKYLKSISHKYDIVYFDFSQIFIYSLFLNHHRKIFMSHDVISQANKRKKGIIPRITQVYLETTEKIIFKSSNEIFCFSQKDKSIINNKYKLNAKVVSFYIDKSITNINFNSLIIFDYFVLYGAWNRPENENGLVWFFKNVYPYVQKIKVKIIGPNLSHHAKSLISQYEYVEYLGFVSNPYIIISQSQGLIAPLFEGAGVKVKVIESLATGTPVIGTEIALEGIDMDDIEKYISLVKDSDAFICILNKYKNITKDDKIELKNKFLENYNQNKFLQYV